MHAAVRELVCTWRSWRAREGRRLLLLVLLVLLVLLLLLGGELDAIAVERGEVLASKLMKPLLCNDTKRQYNKSPNMKAKAQGLRGGQEDKGAGGRRDERNQRPGRTITGGVKTEEPRW